MVLGSFSSWIRFFWRDPLGKGTAYVRLLTRAQSSVIRCPGTSPARTCAASQLPVWYPYMIANAAGCRLRWSSSRPVVLQILDSQKLDHTIVWETSASIFRILWSRRSTTIRSSLPKVYGLVSNISGNYSTSAASCQIPLIADQIGHRCHFTHPTMTGLRRCQNTINFNTIPQRWYLTIEGTGTTEARLIARTFQYSLHYRWLQNVIILTIDFIRSIVFQLLH